MPLCTVRAQALGKPGETESHFGHLCTIGEAKDLVADVPEALLETELAAGRVTVIEQAKKAKKATE